ncbi:MAG: Crp/Fnr family transcriptional regulator [Bradyrhizobiaceae bacterium]|nr:MAG: Crp/Fnr family transcriptional regulator [Bradyrhizobiaceae bacterium]
MTSFQEKSGTLPVDCVACRASIEDLCKDCALAIRQVLVGYKLGDRTIKAGDDLFRPAEPCAALYFIFEGWMFLYSLIEDGRRQILHFALPGSLLGLYPGRTAIYGVEALTNAVVCAIPHEHLGPLIEKHPGIGLRLAWTVWRERNLAYDRLSSIGRRSARERVARLLLELFVRYRMMWPAYRSEEMHLPLTQEHIGDATGMSGIHVNRVLRGLRNEGIVEFHYRRLRILNPDRLVDIAGVDPQTILSWTERYPST